LTVGKYTPHFMAEADPFGRILLLSVTWFCAAAIYQTVQAMWWCLKLAIQVIASVL